MNRRTQQIIEALGSIGLLWSLLWGGEARAAFPVGWAGYCVPSAIAAPGSTVADFTYLVSLDQMPSGFWTAVQTDGDDIRATKADGTTELAVDIIEFTDSGSSGSGLIAVKYSGNQTTSPGAIWIWAGDPTASRPATSDTYGQFNAYASHWKGFWPSGLGNDRTSFANNLTAIGSPTVGGQAGPINGSLSTDLNGSTQYGISTISVPTAAPITMIAMGHSDSATVTQSPLALTDTAGDNDAMWIEFGGATGGDPIRADAYRGSSGVAATSTGYSTATWTHAAGVFTSATSRAAYINAGSVGSSVVSKAPLSLDTICVGVLDQATVLPFKFDGRLSLVHLHTSALSADWLSYDKEMLDDADQSDFYGTWSWTAATSPIVLKILQLSESAHRQRRHLQTYGVYALPL